MSDSPSQAKQARETLARALGALQSDPSVPPGLMAVAEPVAQAMGALHAIERSGSVATAPAARDHVRAALGLLQAQPTDHPAVAQAMESVAGSLGLIFGLVKLAEAGGAPAAQPVQQQAPQPQYQAPPQQAYQAPPQQAAPQPQFQAPPQQAYQAPPQQAAPQPQYQAPPQQAAAPAVNPYAQPVQPAPQAAAQPGKAAAAPAPGPPAPAGSARFEGSLGTNSPTNFYKGLSGNDVVEHGGIFIATYSKLPPVGATIALRITMPGGYEFESVATVAWTRDQRGGGDDMQPGFGARFTQIAPEARQLIYRYVRNREPLFHDDF